MLDARNRPWCDNNPRSCASTWTPAAYNARLTLATERLTLSEASEQLAESFAQAGLTAIDALLVALAATARASYFVTADDKLLRRGKTLPGLTVSPVSILGLITEISK